MTSTTPYVEHLRAPSQSVAPSSINPETRTVTICFYSGTEIQRADPYSGESFALVFDPAGADLSRLAAGTAPVLDSHEQQPVGRQIGVVLSARQVGKQFFAEIKFSDRPEVDGLWRDVAAGIVRNVSMGVEIHRYKDERDKAGKLTRRIVTSWKVFEISLVAVPADPEAITLNHNIGLETSSMTNETTNINGTGAGIAAAPNGAESLEIQKILGKANLGDDFNTALLAKNPTTAQARDQVFGELARRDMLIDTRHGNPLITMGREYTETNREGMVDALMARTSGKAPTENARRFIGMRLVDMARECLSWRGVRSWAGESAVMSEALAQQNAADFPNILGNYANKVLLQTYEAAEGALKKVARRSTANDFKLKRLMRRGEFPQLFKVTEGASYVTGAVAESAESYKLDTFGRIFNITRQALINDDLGAFSDMAQSIGLAVANFEDQFLVDLLTSGSGDGPVMADGQNLFNAANHFNKSAAGAAISDTTLDTARIAMRTQKGVDGVTIVDATPRFLVVPVAKQTAAEKYLTSIYAATAATVNPFGGKLELLVDPRLDAKSSTRWYLFSDPTIVPSLEYSYLSGAEGPQIEKELGFEVDGLSLKVRLDFGGAAIDWRGCYANAGA